MLSLFRSQPRATPPSIAEVATLVAAERMVLVDVREMEEVRASGRAEGAKVIPLSLLGLKTDPNSPACELPMGLPIAVYCASGGRSAMAADALQRLGYGPVYNLGGLRDWAAGGGRVVPLG